MTQIVDGVEHQFRLAARTLGRLRGQDRPRETLTYWPDIVQSFHEAYGSAPVTIRPAIPTGREIDQLDRVLEWLWLTPQHDWPLIWARSVGMSWRKAARAAGTDHMTAKRRFERAMETVAEHLIVNGAMN